MKSLLEVVLPKIARGGRNAHLNYRFFSADAVAVKRIKAAFRNANQFNHLLPGSHCLLPISVGQLSHDVQSPHEGEKFKATAELLNRVGIGRCTILVDDDIQLDTYGILYPSEGNEKLHKIVLAVGDKWLEQHEQYYKRLEMPYEIKRWQDVASDPDYENGVKKVRAKYLYDPNYKEAFDRNINQFLTRLEKRGIKFDKEYAFQQCWNYLIHENAGMGFVWPKWKPDFEVYPSGRNDSMQATYDAFIKGHDEYNKFLKIIALRFSKSNIVGESHESLLSMSN